MPTGRLGARLTGRPRLRGWSKRLVGHAARAALGRLSVALSGSGGAGRRRARVGSPGRSVASPRRVARERATTSPPTSSVDRRAERRHHEGSRPDLVDAPTPRCRL